MKRQAELMKKYSGDKGKVTKTRKKSGKPGIRRHDAILPGSILIILSGRFRGKRVVYLKELDSGLLLVTGPFSINGVPLRRVSRAYVVVTSTKIDVSNVNVDKFDDTYFKKEKTSAKSAEFFDDAVKPERKMNPERIQDQVRVDAAIKTEISKVSKLAAFLKSTFSLSNGVYPHLTRF